VNILAPNIGYFQMGPQKQNLDYLKNDYNDFDHISIIYRDNRHK
jgi:hypothetical protein